ncbi:hypothetical protein [Halorussus marinus]|uniref:hypothetical protein n=1 Tax=Halorussus marinus TaxID=2505976 RepID=UPI00106DE63A|nr:hypothetical protein [Halorussus marinus]
MKQYPSIPGVEDAPDRLFDRGHLWLQELIDGAHLRFRLRESGEIAFGGRDRTYDSDAIPLAVRHAVRHVRERLDRESLRGALESAGDAVFFGVATTYRAVAYDWERTPPFLGVDVWSAADDRFLPPDAVERIYDRLGLAAVNAFEKELRAADFDPSTYEIPDSDWYDGPAAGVVVRNKTGDRAALVDPDVRELTEPTPVEAPVAELARRHATDARFERLARELADRGIAITFDAMYERTIETIARETRLFDGDAGVDPSAFRSETAPLLKRFLSER